jgi:hypothetical protein
MQVAAQTPTPEAEAMLKKVSVRIWWRQRNWRKNGEPQFLESSAAMEVTQRESQTWQLLFRALTPQMSHRILRRSKPLSGICGSHIRP